jgi:hypothetical protein
LWSVWRKNAEIIVALLFLHLAEGRNELLLIYCTVDGSAGGGSGDANLLPVDTQVLVPAGAASSFDATPKSCCSGACAAPTSEWMSQLG